MNLGARTAAWSKSLPYDAEVEYLKSSGNEYIDTLIVPDSSKTMGCDVCVSLPSGNGDTTVCGVMRGSGNYRFIGFYSGNYIVQRGGSWQNIHSCEYDVFHKVKTIFYNIYVEKYYDDELVGTSSFSSKPSFLAGDSLYLFAQNNSGASVVRKIKASIKSVKISVANDIVFDAVPVRFTNENGVSEGAMYDRVSKQLFRNAGTGAFTWGELT